MTRQSRSLLTIQRRCRSPAASEKRCAGLPDERHRGGVRGRAARPPGLAPRRSVARPAVRGALHLRTPATSGCRPGRTINVARSAALAAAAHGAVMDLLRHRRRRRWTPDDVCVVGGDAA